MTSHAAPDAQLFPAAHQRGPVAWLPALREAALRHERAGLQLLLMAAAALHLAIHVGSPRSFGYVYDPYPAGVAYVYDHGALPPPEACWVCAHPPLLWIVGAPFYAAGMALSGADRAAGERALCLLPLLCDALILASCYQLLRLFGRRGLGLWFGMALCALLPCLAISGCGPESDVLLTALMSAGLVLVCRVHLAARPALRHALALGALSGLALLTKYSGVLLLLLALGVYAARAWRAREPATLRHALVCLGCALALSGAQYVHNLQSRHELLVANGSARSGFAVLDVGERLRNLAHYELGSLRLREAVALFDARVAGSLDAQPVYASVWTSLHAMAWTDMSMFSVHSRHGDPSLPYPDKRIPLGLVAWLLGLGLVPGALALLGLARRWHAPDHWPLAAYTAATAITYAWWFLAQDSWALKTKYILFLLPVYALLASDGLERVLCLPGRVGAWASAATLTCLCGLFACAAAYIAVFALA